MNDRNDTFNYFVFLESHVYEPRHKNIKGATSRLTAIVADQIQKAYGINVHYVSIKKNQELEDVNFDFEKVNQKDIGIFVRFQFPTSLDVLTEFQKRGGIAVLHFTDPHALNIQNIDRLKLHVKCLDQADGVIATSDRLKEIAKQFVSKEKQDHVFYIPDTVDVNYREPQIKPIQDQLRLVTACYSVHHESILNSIPAINDFASENKIKIDYQLVTSQPRKDQLNSHGKSSSFEEMMNYQSEFLKIHYVPFSVDNLEIALSDSDAYLIQAIDTDSEFKRIWIPSKGSIRLVQAFAGGIPVILQGEIGNSLPLSYNSFANWCIYGNNLKDLLRQLCKQSKEDLDALQEKVKIAQNYIRSDRDSKLIAKEYLQSFQYLQTSA